jgi:hypothetical protein
MIYNILDAFVIVFSCLSFVLGTLSLRGNASGWCVQLYPTGGDPSEKKKLVKLGDTSIPGIMKTTNIQSPKEKLLENFAVLTNQNRT